MFRLTLKSIINASIYLLSFILNKFLHLFGKELSVSSQNTVNQFVLFCFVGVSNTLVYYVCYIFLFFAGVNYIVANIVGFTFGVFNSFYLNNKYVFKQKDRYIRFILQQFIRTYASYFFSGIILSNIILFYCTNHIGLSEIVSPLICLLFTIPTNFVLNKYWAYRITSKA